MSPDLQTCIGFLEQNNDPRVAYFSFGVDPTGEWGVIKANKEGLRLYAAEILKRSLELEEKKNGQLIPFGPLEWLVSEAGYDLIQGVMPEYQSREEL
jgi:hypothetical protein